MTSREDSLLRLKQFIPSIIPISKSSWLNGVKEGRYPKPIHLGPRTTAWRYSDIMRVVEGMV